MCGINGIFAYSRAAPPVREAELVASRDHMRRRGPDGDGKWIDDERRVGLGHRRLAIIDLSPTGAQPMPSRDGALMLTYNGEIYNYRALRAELAAEGAVFASESDSEVLLQLYERRGADMLRGVRGMYAFAIWDARKRQLFLARDPLGIKPLYYADDGATFRFASQVKAIVAGGAVRPEIEPAGAAGFYLWGSVPEPWTIYRGVHALPAGCTLTVTREGAEAPRRFHSVAETYREAEANAAETSDAAIATALADSVKHHLVADVPVGCFLSAGIDSGALLGLMRDAGASDVQAVTLGFEEFRGGANDETVLAAHVAKHYGATHHVRMVGEREFADDLPQILAAMDQPTIDGINSWFVSKAAHEMGLKVMMSGLGGDELFGGYPSFRDLPSWTGKLGMVRHVRPLGALARAVVQQVGPARLGMHPKTAGMLEYGGSYAGSYLLRRGLFMPWELGELLDREMLRAGLARLGEDFGVARALDPEPETAFGKVATLETALYMRNQLLRDTDWASMAHSLEVRVPLVDPVLLASVAPAMVARGAVGKGVLAAAPSKPLPDVVTNRRKTGFYTPVDQWIERQIGPAAPTGRTTASRDWARALIERGGWDASAPEPVARRAHA